MHKLAILSLHLALAMPTPGAEPAFGPEARAKSIAPLLDDQVLAVVRFDVARPDLDVTLASLLAVVHPSPADLDELTKELHDTFAALSKAGGKELFLLVHLADLPGQPPCLVVPLAAGADVQALTQALGRSRLVPGLHVDKLGQAIVGGSEKTLRRLRALKPVPRPEVAKAFAAAGDTAAQVLFVPPADVRRAFEETMPTMPFEVGGGPSTVVTRGVQWAALGVDTAPKAEVRLVVQSHDAASAKALREWVGVAVKAFGDQKPSPEWAFFGRLVGQVGLADKLVLTDDRLTLTLDSKAVEGVATSGYRHAAERAQTTRNFRQLGIALHNYLDTTGSFPAVANFDKQGKPLLSWRVHLLPYVGEGALYKEFRLDEPWDSEHNRKLSARIPKVYQSANRQLVEAGKTTLLAPVHESTVFTGGTKGLRIRDITDGTSNTILLVDAEDKEAVLWTKPADLAYDPKKPRAGLNRRYDVDGFLAVFGDATVRLVSKTVSEATLHACFTRAGGEVLGADAP